MPAVNTRSQYFCDWLIFSFFLLTPSVLHRVILLQNNYLDANAPNIQFSVTFNETFITIGCEFLLFIAKSVFYMIWGERITSEKYV